LEELRQIYISRGLEPNLAKSVAKQLMEHDALAAHARDELGISEIQLARPIQAAITSAITFACGAVLPLLAGYMVDSKNIILSVSIASIIVLAFLGGLAAKMGGANILRGISRVVFWGALAMGITAGVGNIFGVNV
jgi:VIT1/CCC1 family predicted Fe2+/Mn2+ transporter